jgi:hypothetical protein
MSHHRHHQTVSNSAWQLPPTRTRKWHARLTHDCRDAVKTNPIRGQPTVAKVPLRRIVFRQPVGLRITLNFPRTWFRSRLSRPLCPSSSTVRTNEFGTFPEARPDTPRAPFDVRWTVARDTSQPTLCSPPIQFSKTSTHGPCGYQAACEVPLVQPGERTQFTLGSPLRIGFPEEEGLLVPPPKEENRSSDIPSPPAVSPPSTTKLASTKGPRETPSLPQARMPSVDSHPKT